ncbi:hypothetical protein CS0771_53270 [Catellatospora sp. IY07-71]|uniref:hypothetical protein n=1 Tax=Catellatospora sp. IY07-71 TaxID=2728827 RepID=UPI001BB3EBFB|nr:hypothetical protein [Catellatospora sp. IY07-71]BCJ75783.1 hypothetical protein CS0771_53270 [Catellatospora sp. IY07-71]
MGIEEKLSNLSRRCAGRSMELAGRISHNARWQSAGYRIWTSARDEETREKAKDAAKALDAVAAYGLLDGPLLRRVTPDMPLGGVATVRTGLPAAPEVWVRPGSGPVTHPQDGPAPR